MYGDIFARVVKQIKDRNFSDADIMIKSNTKISVQQWLEYITVTNQLFGPILGVVGGAVGAVLGAAAFLSQIGLEINQAVNGDSEEERQQGLLVASMDVGTTLLFAGCAGFHGTYSNDITDIIDKAYINNFSKNTNAKIYADKVNLQADIAFRPDIGKDVFVILNGKENGREVWGQLNPVTREPFARKYFRNTNGVLEECNAQIFNKKQTTKI